MHLKVVPEVVFETLGDRGTVFVPYKIIVF